MTSYLSNKLRFFSFFLMLLVVYIHSYNIQPNAGDGINFYVQNFISHGLARIGVPLFFMISGYLFFLKTRFTDIFEKIESRIRTLLLPYLIWSIFGILFFLLLESIPPLSPYFSGVSEKEYSIDDFWRKFLFEPIPFQLWFIRDLFFLVLLSPFLYVAIKRFRYFFPILLFLPWFFSFDLFDIIENDTFKQLIFKNKLGLPFFSLGAFMGIRNKDVVLKPNKWCHVLPAISISLMMVKTALLPYFQDRYLIDFLHNTGIIVGIVSVWVLYDYWSDVMPDVRKYRFLFSSSFFLFVLHEPLLTLLQYGVYTFLGYDQVISLFTYFSLSLLVIVLSLVLSRLFKVKFPRIYSVVTGGR